MLARITSEGAVLELNWDFQISSGPQDYVETFYVLVSFFSLRH